MMLVENDKGGGRDVFGPSSFLDPAQLVHEDEQDAERTDVFHAEEVEVEETHAQRAPVAVFVAYQLVGEMPAHKQTGEETADGEEQLSGDEVEDVEQRPAQHMQLFVLPQ